MSAELVTIFDLWKATPVFHLHRSWDDDHRVARLERDDGLVEVSHRWTTACGQRVNWWGWTEDPAEVDWAKRSSESWDQHRGTQLRRDHAEKIGRLCQRCEAALS